MITVYLQSKQRLPTLCKMQTCLSEPNFVHKIKPKYILKADQGKRQIKCDTKLSYKCDQGGNHTTESVETVQGFAAAKQEKEEGKEKVENEENTRRMKKNK